MTSDINEVVRQVEPDTQKEIVALTVYYLEKVEDYDTVERSDIRTQLESAKVHVPRRNISSYISRLLDEEILVPHGNSGVSLSWSDEQKYNELVDLNDENSVVREASFIEYSGVEDEFYQELINDINIAYRSSLDDATLILSRKLLENLILDLLRLRYGLDDERRELFYDTNNGRLLGFSRLLDNIKENIGDFEYFTDRFDKEVVQEIEQLKGRGDASAHSIEVNVDEDMLDEHRAGVNPVVEILFYTKKKIEASESG